MLQYMFKTTAAHKQSFQKAQSDPPENQSEAPEAFHFILRKVHV